MYLLDETHFSIIIVPQVVFAPKERFKRNTKGSLCNVLPKLTQGRIKEVIPELQDDGFFSSKNDIKEYWKLKYGYELPDFSFYYKVEIGNHYMTYPSCCIVETANLSILPHQTKLQAPIIQNAFFQALLEIKAYGKQVIFAISENSFSPTSEFINFSKFASCKNNYLVNLKQEIKIPQHLPNASSEDSHTLKTTKSVTEMRSLPSFNRNHSVCIRRVKELLPTEKSKCKNDSVKPTISQRTNDKGNSVNDKKVHKKISATDFNKKKHDLASTEQIKAVDSTNSASQKKCQAEVKNTEKVKTDKAECCKKDHHHHHHHHHKKVDKSQSSKNEQSVDETNGLKGCDELTIKKFKKYASRDTIPGKVSAKSMKAFLESVGKNPTGTRDDLFKQLKQFFASDSKKQEIDERPRKQRKVAEE